MIARLATHLLAALGLLAQSAVPGIDKALSCRREGVAGNLADGTEMQRHDIDLKRYPNALCNDGSGAVFYYRPFQGAANRNRWVIQIQGGGTCGRPDECAKRWCSVDTGFSSIGMSSDSAPARAINGAGITERRADNPVGNWNHVLVKYCSSDAWSGTARGTIVETADPATGAPVVMRIHFLGSRILDAAIGTLRRVGGATLRHTLSGDAEMPNLDDAEFVVLAGASAGGGGIIHNADRIADSLRRFNNQCRANRNCPLAVRALQDSAFHPERMNLDYSTSVLCQQFGVCSAEAEYEFQAEEGQSALWRARGDESCPEWHRKNLPGTEWQCEDNPHVLTNHITTPIFVRMGQGDELISESYIGQGFTVPGSGPMTLASFGGIVRSQVLDLANAKSKAHEGADITVTPGGFSPTCKNHEVLRSNFDIFNVRITQGGDAHRMFDVVANWLEGRSPSIVVAPNAAANNCAP